MSRSVPFDDPLLHPPTPPPREAAAATASTGPPPPPPPPADPFDDGPIPFQSATAKAEPSVFSPPPFRAQSAVDASHTATSSATASATDAIEQSPNFIDPLNAALGSQGDDSGASSQAAETTSASGSTRPSSSLSINVPATHNSMPTEFPTHLASPPLPQRPLSIGGTAFTAFQAFSSALQPPTTSGTPVSVSGSGVGTPLPGETSNLPLEDSINDIGRVVYQPSVGLGLESGSDTQKDAPTTPGQHAPAWNARLSMGVSTTNPSGISFQDHPDLVRQELKSPVQEQHSIHHPLASITAVPAQPWNGGVPLNIRPVEHGREHPVGIRSPGFTVPQSPMRPEGFPVLNAINMFHEITMVDALNDLMIKHVPAEQRVLRDWNALTEAEQSQEPRSKVLYTLTVENSWRAMARYTRSQILLTPPDRILELINLWYARLLALVKLGQYEMAQAELDQLDDLRGPQYRYENYPADMFANSDIQTPEQERGVAIRRGCMVPFELFVLKARLQGYLGDIPEAIDQLYDLIIHCKKFEAICGVSDDTVGVRQWQDITGQLHLMVLNYLVEMKDFPAATRHARDLAKKYSQDINFRSGLGRLYLQLGDVDRADKEFKELEDFVKGHLEHHSATEQAHFKLQLTMNEALLAVTQGRWLAAKSAFEEVLVQEPENLAATNNLAVCELYAGHLNDAIPRIEKLMFAYPTSAGTSEALVFNMATLYELRTEGSLRRKQQMMVEVAKWAGDQFNVSTFKI
ncbi:hypothetical protein BGZ70_006261 [Mortierella alpina]|uniref:Trafficking protein particle complex subunit 12 n=1 Tax=Mortierella alpina TaxID=64518 RepID=A0A9P6J808_MORAP|nr:hypothetical protein BGZ70_006261 [Mortierella alpina]